MQDGGAHRFYEKTAVHNEYNAQKPTILAAKSHGKCLTLKTVALAPEANALRYSKKRLLDPLLPWKIALKELLRLLMGINWG